MKVIVTGGGGFLGRYIVKELLDVGHEVVSFSRKHHRTLDKLGVKTIEGNIISYTDVSAALKGADAVFHVASKIGMGGLWKDFYFANIVGTENIIKASLEHQIKYLIYTSTPSVAFGKKALEGVDETIPLPKHHLNYYARSKAQAERSVLEVSDTKLKTVALRPHLIFGPGDPNLLPRVIEQAKSGRLKQVGKGDNLVDIIYVENAARAHLLAFAELQGEAKCNRKAYFLGQERPVNLWQFINQFLKMVGEKQVSSQISLKAAYRIGALIEFIYYILRIEKDPPMTRFMALQLGMSHYFNHTNAQSDFGYYPLISIEEGMKKYLKSLERC